MALRGRDAAPVDIQKQRDREERYRAAAQPQLDEPVLAAALFRRRRRSVRAPQLLLIAVTPMHIHAFAADAEGDVPDVGTEIAAWERSGVDVEVADNSVSTKVTIEPHGGGEKLVCTIGKDALSRSVVRFIADPAVVAA